MRESREKEESFRYERGDGTYAESWDKVTTFYDVTGKRLFLCVLQEASIVLTVCDRSVNLV